MKSQAPFAAVLIVVAACGARTSLSTRPATGSGVDGGAGGDSGQAGCHPLPNPYPIAICTPEAQQQCQRWAQSLTTNGYAHATCWLDERDTRCLMGDTYCAVSPNPPMRADCICGGAGKGDRQCANNEVCVGDTPNGPSTCRSICLADCEPAPCTRAGDVCWCDRDVCGSNRVCALYAPNQPPLSCQSQCPDAG